jgi:hypothetical protein
MVLVGVLLAFLCEEAVEFATLLELIVPLLELDFLDLGPLEKERILAILDLQIP